LQILHYAPRVEFSGLSELARHAICLLPSQCNQWTRTGQAHVRSGHARSSPFVIRWNEANLSKCVEQLYDPSYSGSSLPTSLGFLGRLGSLNW